MADINQLSQALIKADAAGDEQAARILAREIARMRSAIEADLPPMTPPPGAVVHGSDGVTTAYGVDGPVSMQRSASEIGGAEDARRSNIEQEALRARSGGTSSMGRAMMPAYQGLTLGWGDEAAANLAGLKGAVQGRSFSDSRDLSQEIQRQELDRERADNPGRAALSELGGNIATSVAAPAMGGRSLLGAGLEAAGYGAVQGAGNATDDDQNASRLEGGWYGGLVGGAVGSGVAGAGRAVAPMIERAGDALAMRSAKFSGAPQDQAAARILAVAQKQGLTPQQAQAQLQRLGPEGMVADVLGTGGQRMLRTAANTDDAAQQIAEDALMRRSAAAPDRLADAVASAGGVKQGDTIDGLTRRIRDSMQPEISALYKEAKDAGADLPREPFRNLLQSPLVKAAYDKAYNETKDRVIAFGQGENSSLAVWDATKKNLDAFAEAAKRSGDLSTYTLAGKLARSVRETVDEFTPVYSVARDAGKELQRRISSVEAGGAAARRPNAEAVDALRSSEYRKAAAKGYATEMVDMILSKRGTPGLVDSLLGSPNQVSTMLEALGEKAGKVAERADIERQFARTQRGATGNSSTARQLADLGVIPGAAGIGYLGGYDPMQAGGVAALLVAGRRGVNKLLDARRSKVEAEVAQEIAKLMTVRSLPKAPARAIQGSEKRIAELLAKLVRMAPVPAAVMATNQQGN